MKADILLTVEYEDKVSSDLGVSISATDAVLSYVVGTLEGNILFDHLPISILGYKISLSG